MLDSFHEPERRAERRQPSQADVADAAAASFQGAEESQEEGEVTEEMIEAGFRTLEGGEWSGSTAYNEWIAADLQRPGCRIEDVLRAIYLAMKSVRP